MLYRQVILRRSLPFAVEIPNAETEAAIDQAIEGKDLAEWADLDALKRARG
jgi:antitoxin component of RelBE/YafQ-DinJ toxin-antitoxin module